MKSTAFDELPIVGTLRQCTHTETGWRGVDETGVVIEVRSWAQVRGFTTSPAMIPDDNRIVKAVNGKRVGILALKRKRGSS